MIAIAQNISTKQASCSKSLQDHVQAAVLNEVFTLRPPVRPGGEDGVRIGSDHGDVHQVHQDDGDHQRPIAW